MIPLHPTLDGRLAAMRRSTGHVVVRPLSGRPYRPRDLSTEVSRVLRAMGIDATAHQLRHSFGTEAARASGGDLLAVASLMGHRTTRTTLGYARLAGGRGADVVQAMWGS